MAKAGGGGGRAGKQGGIQVGGKRLTTRRFLKRVVNAQKELLDWQRTHKQSASVRHRMDRALGTLARARYSPIGPEQASRFAAAAKVIEMLDSGGTRAIAYRYTP